MASAKPPVFVRSATGLVRSLSAWDMFFFNMVIFGGAWSIIYALEYAPLYGGNPVVGILLTAPGILCLFGVYYIFQVSMPRSGGEYVFVSRVLHPSLGLAASFVGVAGFFSWFWTGDSVTVSLSQGLAQTLSVYGSLSGQQWATNAVAALTPVTIFILSTILISVFAAIVILSTRLYFWVQNISMIIAILALVIIVVLLATTNPTSFASALNAYASNRGLKLSGGAYQNLTNAGTTYWGGSMPTSPISGYTFMLVPLWMTALIWFIASNYMGGEIKNVRSSAKIALFGSFGVTALITILVFQFAYSNLGANFLAGASYYAFGYSPNPLPVIPNLTFFAAVITNNPLLVWLIGVGIIAGFVLPCPMQMLIMSRTIFAYSFDRLAPSSLADVSERWHTPIKSILIAAIGGEVFVIFLSGIVGASTASTALLLYSYGALASISVTFVLLSISAIVFPFRKKSLYQTACPVRRRIVGLPLITWLGIIALTYSLATIIYYSYNYNFYFGTGTVLANDYFPFLGAVAALFLGCIMWFYIAKSIRSKGGVSFEKVFQEIPPE